MKNLMSIKKYLWQSAFAFLLFTFSLSAAFAQPAPSAPRSGIIPAVKEKKLVNGLTVAVVERKDVPLVTVQLLIKSGAAAEDAAKAGLADLTASMLTKGTKTRTATQIAEQMEFLGGSINTGAGWNNSVVTLTVTSDKLDKAMAIMADVVLNPAFDQKELDLLKSQALDGLTYNLTQPAFLGNYVASKYSFDEHPAGGTPGSLATISRAEITTFAKNNYVPKNAVLIFAGDINSITANALTQKYLGRWAGTAPRTNVQKFITAAPEDQQPILERILVVDLPNSGQASVSFAKQTTFGRNKDTVFYYPSSVLNSVLGGGYSSRLNQEIRIKRGLSYGAGSSFAWRPATHSFSTRTQTKNESAAEVTELVLKELARLSSEDISEAELVPRKSVLTGGFGRELETTAGLVAQLSQLYVFGIPTSELNSYLTNIQTVPAEEIKRYALYNINRGDIIIVGDYAIFKDDLAKRFPNIKVDVIKAAELDISKENLRK